MLLAYGKTAWLASCASVLVPLAASRSVVTQAQRHVSTPGRTELGSGQAGRDVTAEPLAEHILSARAQKGAWRCKHMYELA